MLAIGYVAPPADAAALPLPVRLVSAQARVSPAGPPPEAYPYRSRSHLVSLDPYGFVAGECTSFVAWWLNEHGVDLAVLTVGPGGPGAFLNADGWDGAARAAGYQVGAVPVVGAVAQWHSGETGHRVGADGSVTALVAGAPGHVAVVVDVRPDGQAVWAELNWADAPGLHLGFGSAPRYLYLGVDAPGLSRGA